MQEIKNPISKQQIQLPKDLAIHLEKVVETIDLIKNWKVKTSNPINKELIKLSKDLTHHLEKSYELIDKING